jgi:serine/threonine-protein kinase RsbW
MRTRTKTTEEATVDVKFCLMFPREAVSVPVMRRVLGDTLRDLGVDAGAVDDLLLAVTEACTNVLQHSGQGHRYEVVASVSEGGCLVEVVDSGAGFRPGRQVRGRLTAHRGPLTAAPHGPVTPRGRLARVRHAAVSRATGGRAGALRAPEVAVDDLPEHGRGLAIMEACVDDVSLRTGPGRGTVVSLRKHIDWQAGQLRDTG